jgi:hypothetical protein
MVQGVEIYHLHRRSYIVCLVFSLCFSFSLYTQHEGEMCDGEMQRLQKWKMQKMHIPYPLHHNRLPAVVFTANSCDPFSSLSCVLQ